FSIIVNGKSHTFDCFECAINSLAPRCQHCHTKVIGHGVEAKGQIFCCAHCAHESNFQEITDRI
ncbi:MAG: hypothetical protein ACXVC3_20120, partial [Bdellovibrio sp.]